MARPRKTADDVLMKSAELLGWALGGLEREIVETRRRLDTLTAQADSLRRRIGTEARSVATAAVRAARREASTADAAVSGGEPTPKRRTVSAETRRKMSEMMRQRWAERRKQNG